MPLGPTPLWLGLGSYMGAAFDVWGNLFWVNKFVVWGCEFSGFVLLLEVLEKLWNLILDFKGT